LPYPADSGWQTQYSEEFAARRLKNADDALTAGFSLSSAISPSEKLRKQRGFSSVRRPSQIERFGKAPQLHLWTRPLY
jgi:hypothetical protein